LTSIEHSSKAAKIETAIIAAADRLRCCRMCPRNCGVDRTAGGRGYCGLDDKAHCFREMLHPAEEAELSPSHQIYFTGCNLRCRYCSVLEWNEQPMTVPEMDVDQLVRAVERRRGQGAKNVNLLGGEPAVSWPAILTFLSRIPSPMPVVLNSNMYYNECVDELLRGLVDICLADLKCGSRRCGATLLDADDYCDVARRNIRMASEHTDLIVRHLIVPGHMECCTKPTLNWLAAELPGVKVSLRTNYVPPVDPAAPEQYVSSHEAQTALDYAHQMGLHLIQ
jgi:putative pyruvate formate lyase activating enzyme